MQASNQTSVCFQGGRVHYCQLTLYTNAIQATQFRTHSFSFFISKTDCRFTYWRPSSRTSSISITQKQIGSLSSSGAFHMLWNTFVAFTPRLLASRTTESSQGSWSRMRCFKTFNCQTGEIVVLKDTWRVSTYNPGGRIYRNLHEVTVFSIAELITPGDGVGHV